MATFTWQRINVPEETVREPMGKKLTNQLHRALSYAVLAGILGGFFALNIFVVNSMQGFGLTVARIASLFVEIGALWVWNSRAG